MLEKGVRLGSYSILNHIASNSRGDTYLAENRRSQQQVVLKIFTQERIYPGQTSPGEGSDLFTKQAQELSQLHHPHILPLLDYGEVLLEKSTHLYFVTRFCPGGSLTEWREQHQPSLLDAARLVSQMANALQYVHDRGIMHQNVKSSNLLLDSHDKNAEQLSEAPWLLTDFMPESAAYETIGIVPVDNRQVTPFWAPEQLEGKPTFASDQYALAVVAYWFLSGRIPFENKHENDKHVLQEAGHGSQMQTLVENASLPIPSELQSVFLRALSSDPENRYSSITAFAEHFEKAIGTVLAPVAPVHNANNALYRLSTEVHAVEEVQAASITIPASEEQHRRGNDIYVQIPISSMNARRGTTGKVTLPGGRIVSVPIPPHTKNGQVIRLANQGEIPSGGGVPGALIVTIITSSVLDSNIFLKTVNTVQRARITILAMIALLVIIDAIVLLTLSNVTRANVMNDAYANITATARIHNLIADSIAGSATAQAQITNARYPFSNTVVLDDPLTSNDKNDGWSSSTDCQFSNNAYHVTTPNQNSYDYCEASNIVFGKFTLQVQMEISQGNCGGIMFRENALNNQGYFFMVCQDGSYSLSIEQGDASFKNFKLLASHSSPAINKGIDQTNLIAIVAQDKVISLYANNHLLDSLQDSTYSLGQIAFFAFPHSLSPSNQRHQTEVIYSNVKAWILGPSS